MQYLFELWNRLNLKSKSSLRRTYSFAFESKMIFIIKKDL